MVSPPVFQSRKRQRRFLAPPSLTLPALMGGVVYPACLPGARPIGAKSLNETRRAAPLLLETAPHPKEFDDALDLTHLAGLPRRHPGALAGQAHRPEGGRE